MSVVKKAKTVILQIRTTDDRRTQLNIIAENTTIPTSARLKVYIESLIKEYEHCGWW